MFTDLDPNAVWLADLQGEQIGVFDFKRRLYYPVRDGQAGEATEPPYRPKGVRSPS